MRALLLSLVLTLFPLIANAGDWDKTDKALGGIAASLWLADWGQTRYISQHPESFYERNVILGNHPSTGHVDTYFALVGVGGYLIADKMSPRNRRLFLIGFSVIEAINVYNNRTIGIRFSF